MALWRSGVRFPSAPPAFSSLFKRDALSFFSGWVPLDLLTCSKEGMYGTSGLLYLPFASKRISSEHRAPYKKRSPLLLGLSDFGSYSLVLIGMRQAFYNFLMTLEACSTQSCLFPLILPINFNFRLTQQQLNNLCMTLL